MTIECMTPFAQKVRQTVTLAELEHVLLSHADRLLVQNVIDAILNNSAWADLIASESHEHDNGFSKIVLSGMLDDEHELRLHFWDGRPVPPSNIHNHTRDYASILLTGTLCNQQFCHSESGDKVFQYRVGARNKAGLYDIKHIGESTLQQLSERRIEAGMSHAAEATELHRIVLPEPKPAVTLFCQGPRQTFETDMFSKDALTAGQHKASPLRRSELLRRLDQIRELLGIDDE